MRASDALRRAFRFGLLLACATALGVPAAAAHPKFKHKKGGKPSQAAARVDASGGPPPWAPAHGYRRKQANGTWIYQPPFGIDVHTCNRELLGAALGGTVGGLLASEIAKGDDRPLAIAGGTLLGILVGGSIGRSMDHLDQSCVGQILEYAPAREPVAWTNPDSDSSYQVTAVRTWEDDDRYCREYQTSATIAGKVQEAYGRACRQPDGSWQIVD